MRASYTSHTNRQLGEIFLREEASRIVRGPLCEAQNKYRRRDNSQQLPSCVERFPTVVHRRMPKSQREDQQNDSPQSPSMPPANPPAICLYVFCSLTCTECVRHPAASTAADSTLWQTIPPTPPVRWDEARASLRPRRDETSP